MLLDIYLGLHSAVEGRPVGPEFVPYHFPDEESLYSYVIGKCPACCHWGKTFKLPEGLPPEAIKELEGTHRECESEDSPCAVTPKDYGCVHFKPKHDEIKTWPAMK